MVDSGTTTNVMPLYVCRRLNAKYIPLDSQITQLDRTNVRVLGEMKDVLIRLSSNTSIYHIIDIVVSDIPYAYGLFSSRDCSQRLNGFFATDWSTLWFPKNGKSNQIKIGRERYLRHTMMELHDPNVPVLFSDSIMGNHMYELDFGNFKAEKSPFF